MLWMKGIKVASVKRRNRESGNAVVRISESVTDLVTLSYSEAG